MAQGVQKKEWLGEKGHLTFVRENSKGAKKGGEPGRG